MDRKQTFNGSKLAYKGIKDLKMVTILNEPISPG